MIFSYAEFFYFAGIKIVSICRTDFRQQEGIEILFFNKCSEFTEPKRRKYFFYIFV